MPVHRRHEPALVQHAPVTNNFCSLFPFIGHGNTLSGEWQSGSSDNPRIVSRTWLEQTNKFTKKDKQNLPEATQSLLGFTPDALPAFPPIIKHRVGFRLQLPSSRRPHCPGTACRSRWFPHAPPRANRRPLFRPPVPPFPGAVAAR